MPPRALEEHDRDDEDDDSVDEDPLESDQDEDDGDEVGETVPCPFCKKPIHEDADVCPKCGNFVGSTDAPRRVPMYIFLGAILAGLCVLIWILM